jgi:hypothetical protein
VTRDEFEARASANPESDYMRGVLREEETDAVWESYYKPVAAAARCLIQTAENVGAAVYLGAGLDDFTAAATGHDVVILMAHWRGAIVADHDLLAPAEQIGRFIQERTHPAIEFMVETAVTARGIVDRLNQLIESRALVKFLPEALGAVAMESAPMGRTLCRDLVDEIFDGLLAPGNQVELFDRLHSPAEMEAALPRSFRGEIDLSICNSEALATYIDLLRRNTIRHLHWPVVVNPIPQFLLVAETLRRLARSGGSPSGGSYVDMRLAVEEELTIEKSVG